MTNKLRKILFSIIIFFLFFLNITNYVSAQEELHINGIQPAEDNDINYDNINNSLEQVESNETEEQKSINKVNETNETNKAIIKELSIEEGEYVGRKYSFTSISNSENGVLYKYVLKDYARDEWTILQDYNEANSFIWKPDRAGKYLIQAQVRDKDSTKRYDTYIEKVIEVKEEPIAKIKNVNITEDRLSELSYIISSIGDSANEVLYKYVLNDCATGKWIILQDYNETNEIIWKPDRTGKYRIQIQVRDKASTRKYDTYIEKFIDVKEALIKEFRIDEGKYVGREYNLISTSSDNDRTLYKYVIKDYTTDEWTVLQDYNETNKFIWKPEKEGKYLIQAQVRDKDSTRRYDTYIEQVIEVKEEPIAKIVNTNIIENGVLGQSYTISSTASSENEVFYKYVVKNCANGKWIILQDYNEESIYTWEPARAGKYLIQAQVRDKYSRRKYDTYIEKEIEVKGAIIKDFVIDEGNYVGREYKLNSISSTNEVLYKYVLKDYSTGEWTILKDYNETDGYIWKPTKAGKYLIQSQVIDKNSPRECDTYIEKVINVKEEPKATITNFKIKAGKYVGEEYNLSTTASSINEVLYKYVIKDCSTGKWTILKDYSKTNSYTWKPIKAGTYRIQGQVRDKDSIEKYDAYIEKIIEIKEKINISYSYYTQTLEEQLAKQMRVNPKTDYGGGVWKNANESEVRFFLDPNNFIEDKLGAGRVIIKSGTLNVISKPGSGSIIETVNKGELYPIIDEKNGWYEIEISNKTGWVPGNHVELIKINSDSMLQFLDLSKLADISSEDINRILEGKGIFEGQGVAFKQASQTHGINEIYLLSHAFLETGNGMSKLAKGIKVDANGRMVDKEGMLVDSYGNYVDLKGNKTATPIKGVGSFITVYNMFGIGAYDDNPIMHGSKRAFDEGWTSPKVAIIGGTSFVSKNYVYNDTYRQNTLYKMRWNPGNPYSYATHQYATDIAWAYKQVNAMKKYYDMCSDYILCFDIPLYL